LAATLIDLGKVRSSNHSLCACLFIASDSAMQNSYFVGTSITVVSFDIGNTFSHAHHWMLALRVIQRVRALLPANDCRSVRIPWMELCLGVSKSWAHQTSAGQLQPA
jgi:hypothetical protein